MRMNDISTNRYKIHLAPTPLAIAAMITGQAQGLRANAPSAVRSMEPLQARIAPEPINASWLLPPN
jgi:hypothetical protein